MRLGSMLDAGDKGARPRSPVRVSEGADAATLAVRFPSGRTVRAALRASRDPLAVGGPNMAALVAAADAGAL